MILGYFEEKITHFGTYIGGIEFVISYLDKTKFREICEIAGDGFNELFTTIKIMASES